MTPDYFGILQEIIKQATQAYGTAMGPCNACSSAGLPIRCAKCGGSTCLEHAWVSGAAVIRKVMPAVLCSKCAAVPLPKGASRRASKPADLGKDRREWARGVLGVGPKATQDEIKVRYRELAKLYHPDHNQGDKSAERKFKEVDEARRVLMNGSRRKARRPTR
jgi:hypothetical protein